MGNNASTSRLSLVKRVFTKEDNKKRNRVFKWPSNINHVQPKERHEDTAAAESTDELNCRPSNYAVVREKYAAIVIQKAFRGYIARRALRALKGMVKLQALVRGYNVRRRAELALNCMQSLVRELHRQRARFSYEGCRKSMVNESNALCESRYRQDIPTRKSMSSDISRATEESDDRPEKALAFASSTVEVEERTEWQDRWMATKPRESHGRASTDKRDSIKEPLHLPSPRCLGEEKCYYSAANSPSSAMEPNYMVATESTRAKARSRNMPRQRPVNSEKDRGGSLAKKKLSYPRGHIP